MATIRNALVIGGGFSGMTAAIQLRKAGIAVDLVEIDPVWAPLGAGITINGPTLRALETIGVYDKFAERGFTSSGADIFAPDGTLIAAIPTPPVVGSSVPGGGGIMRPDLAEILADATRASGVDVRLGCTFTSITQAGDSVAVAFTDGSTRDYDLVVGADGVHSKVRALLFPAAPKPAYSGQAVWRAVLPRPPEVKTTIMWLGPKIKVGVNPVSADEMYLFVTEDRETNDHVDPARFAELLDGLLAPFPAPLVQQCRARIAQQGADARIVYRPLEGLLLPQPWHAGRVVLIGDTVHATTPHMASGACIGIEDAIVLAEEVGRAATVDEAIARFEARRWERCRMVVENSARLGEIEITGGDKDEHGRIMRESLMALAQPI